MRTAKPVKITFKSRQMTVDEERRFEQAASEFLRAFVRHRVHRIQSAGTAAKNHPHPKTGEVVPPSP